MTSGPIRVLLADDAADLRFLLKIALETDGSFAVVAEAEDGAVAVELALAEQPDLVVLDLAMPQMDGLQALPQILDRCPSTVVVVVSGFDEAAVAEEVRRLGAVDYIQKGTPILVLVERLRAAVGLGRGMPARRIPPTVSAAEEFAAAAAHELQNPVTAIAGFAELLEGSWDRFDDDRRRHMAGRIYRQANHLQRLIGGLLAATHAEHGTSP